MAFVYHIHLPEQTGCFEKGYIGFTSVGVEHRWKEHKSLAATPSSRNYPVYNAIRKYGDKLIVTTLIEGSDDYCLEMEKALRPKPNMGWNIAIGGGAPMLGQRHSDATREKLKNAFPPERRQKQSEFAKSVPTWLHGSSDKFVWASADRVYACFKAHDSSIGANLLGKAFGLGIKELEAMRNKFLKGWVPTDDANWLVWSAAQDSKLTAGWSEGDPLVERAKPELTEELRKARGQGGKNRIWTDEAKENLRKLNVGRKHTPETVKKMSEVRKGIPKTEEDKAAIKKRLKERPWTNATAIHANWAKAQYMFDCLKTGKTMADLLREFDLPRKSGTLANICNRIRKDGWNPYEDTFYLAWVAEYNKQKELHESTLSP